MQDRTIPFMLILGGVVFICIGIAGLLFRSGEPVADFIAMVIGIILIDAGIRW